jgi:peptidoglycan/LPS O-acetylase OafA/YrhL
MRIKILDSLRCICCVLVLFQHAPMGGVLQQIGWLGNECFFVLSGYLIAGLLFTQIKNTQTINVGAFLIRRAFKIYPSYFVMFFAMLLFYWLTNKNLATSVIFAELLYVQNYFTGFIGHTWSLAIEEHFYFIFPLVLFIFRKYFLHKPHLIVVSLIGLLLLIYLLRYNFVTSKASTYLDFRQTHLRADGIVFGILLAYLQNFTSYLKKIKPYTFLIFTLGILCLLPAFFYKVGYTFINLYGFTIINFGFFLVFSAIVQNNITPFVQMPAVFKKLNNGLAHIGTHSYNIYLWHILVLYSTSSFKMANVYVHTLVYCILAIVIGIFFTKIIEQPFLQLRNKYFSK